jgi:hypothetical protein
MPDHDAWPAFTLPWNDNTPGPTDMSFLLEQRAGATGFVRIADGHLVRGDGQRWRIWGTNVTFDSPAPPMPLAPIIARRLAKLGINCLRLHHMDHRWPEGILLRRLGPPPASGVQRDNEPTRALDPEGMARLDYFVYCCQQRGIYIDLNLNVSRTFTAADDVKQPEWIGYGKALTYFDPQIILLQKEYAAQLLGHVNPFTGHRYAEEPAVAIVELVNENSILESWAKGRLRGTQTVPFGTWGDIPSSYAEDLDRLWNNWIAAHYPDRATLQAAWSDLGAAEDAARGTVRRLQPEDFAAASARRFADEATFYAEMECRFYCGMADYLRGVVGVRQVIMGTSDHNHGMHGSLHVQNNATLGIVDGHVYWQHPRYRSGEWTSPDWTITNTAQVDAPDHSSVAQLARSRVLGMPYTVSEVNEPFPNDYACEFIPTLAAYGLLQDWDGIFMYCLSGRREQWDNQVIGRFFAMSNDPMKMAETALGALVFLRGDVQAAQQLVERDVTHERVIESLRTDLPDDTYPFELHHLPGRLALTHRTGVRSFTAAANAPAPGAVKLPQAKIASDTNELFWEDVPGDGRVLIDTPRFQALIGRAGLRSTANMTLALETPFAALQLASLEAAPIAEAERLLLVTAARVANTGMCWTDASRTSLGHGWGEAPTRIEVVTGKLALHGLCGAQAVKLWPLDGCGQPAAQGLPFSRAGETWQIVLDGQPATLWYLITVER